MNKTDSIIEPPQHLRDKLPTVAQIVLCVSTGPSAAVSSVKSLYRAANPAAYAWPPSIRNAHRFGPPAALKSDQTALPFSWLYAALEAGTAVWEARFLKNDRRQPGTYYVDPSARRDGVIARLDFETPPLLWDLRGATASRLGIYDYLMGPEHDWCQWFGYYLHCAILSVEPDLRPAGFLYASRRHLGHAAVALHSGSLATLRSCVQITETRFSEYLLAEQICDDGLLASSPEQEA